MGTSSFQVFSLLRAAEQVLLATHDQPSAEHLLLQHRHGRRARQRRCASPPPERAPGVAPRCGPASPGLYPILRQVGEAPPARVRVGIISRRRKRFILNEHELVEAVLSLGYDVQLLPMEEMTLFEQVSSL